MKVILNDHIDHLGERGDVVEVKPGYARNYLLPKRLAYLDSPGNQRRFEQEQKGWEEMDIHRRSAAERMAAEMDGTQLTFERRAGEKDVLFGSVSIVDIGRALADVGFEIDRRRILLGHPIKELGNFEVDVQVHRDIKVTIPVFVVRPGDQPEPIPEEPTAEPEPTETPAVSAEERAGELSGAPEAAEES
jgi:large subunit ribosomal protein L9